MGAQKGVIDVVESKKNFTEMKHLRHTISVNKWRGGNSSSQVNKGMDLEKIREEKASCLL